MISESNGCNLPVPVSLGYNYSCTAPGCSYPCRSLESFVAHSIKHIDFDCKGGRDSETILSKFQDIWYCSLCEFGSTNKIIFTEHLRQHMLPDAYACGRCQASFENVKALKKHNSGVHPRLTTRLKFQKPNGFIDLILGKINEAGEKTFFLKIKEDMIVFICHDMMCWFIAQFKSPERIDLSHVFLSKSLMEEPNVKKISGNCIFTENCFDEAIKKDIERSHFVFLEKLKLQLKHKKIYNNIESDISRIGKYTTQGTSFVCLKCDYCTLDKFQIMEHIWLDIHLVTKNCFHKKVNSSLCNRPICAILDSIISFLCLEISDLPSRLQQNAQNSYLFLSPEHNFNEPEDDNSTEVDQRFLDPKDSSNIHSEGQSSISLQPDCLSSVYLKRSNENLDKVELISDDLPLKHVCDVCTFACNTEHDFDVHKLFCLTSEAQLSGNLTCPKCHFSCDSVNVILDHLSHHLGETQLKVFTCRYCSYMFSSADEVNQHVKQRHSTEHAIAPAKSKCFIKVVKYLDGMMKCCFCGSAHKWPYEYIGHLKDHKNYAHLTAYLSKKYLQGKQIGNLRGTLPKVTFPYRLLTQVDQAVSFIQNRSENSNSSIQDLNESKSRTTSMNSENISAVSTVKCSFKKSLCAGTASNDASVMGYKRKKNVIISGNKLIKDKMQVFSKENVDSGSKNADKSKGDVDKNSVSSKRRSDPDVNDADKLIAEPSVICENIFTIPIKRKKVADEQSDIIAANQGVVVGKNVSSKDDAITLQNLYGNSSNATKLLNRNLPSCQNLGVSSKKSFFYLCNYCNFRSCSMKKYGKHLLICRNNSTVKKHFQHKKKINFFPIVRLENRIDLRSVALS